MTIQMGFQSESELVNAMIRGFTPTTPNPIKPKVYFNLILTPTLTLTLTWTLALTLTLTLTVALTLTLTLPLT